MLEVKNFTVYRNKTPIVKDVSFNVQAGDWLMIVGPNGSGKSTLACGITGLFQTQGQVIFEGKELKKMPSSERAQNMGMLMQANNVSYGFSVKEIVEMGRLNRTKGIIKSKSEYDKQMIENALIKTGLNDLKDRNFLQLSGGEKQRTFLAQLFAQNPKLMILDEPTNNLDLKYQKETFELVKEWLNEGNRAVISVVHDLSLAKAYGTKALIIHEGKIAAQGDCVKTIVPEILDPVYGLNVQTWMQELLAQWQ